MTKLDRFRSRNHRFQTSMDEDLPEQILEKRTRSWKEGECRGVRSLTCTLKRGVSQTSVLRRPGTKNKTLQKHGTRAGRQLSYLQCDSWATGSWTGRALCRCGYRGPGSRGCQGRKVGREGLWTQSRSLAAFKPAFCHHGGFLTLPCFLVLANTLGGSPTWEGGISTS